jgi:uncharacterized membrane protein YccC
MRYDPAGFANTALALLLSMIASAIAFAVLLPPSTPWLRGHLLADLRRQVVLACRAPLSAARARFESRSRDLAFQAHALLEREPDAQRDTLAWLVAVLEVGHAVIDLRRELAALPSDARYAATMPWRRAIAHSGKALIALFARPTDARLDAALAANFDAIAATQQALAAFAPPREDRHRLQRILSYLHFVRTALIDPQSPLARYAGAASRDSAASA